ncbi:TadE-like protein [Rubripirellula obstinata]|uniref:TadE-like protein n=2 Tax=Rubripirellula obstinata TaxID=406547 RepID=A0A5B1CMB8_9BACT|nr:TadE/TadG family type IV pilus assembly protein [Rubripirellula obstinata]KAA1261421.1 TadE-like protein [Rubripirellula obstinata]
MRRGSASIECVLIFPVLLTLTIGTIDVCSAMFLKESAVLAAYEGARQGVGRGYSNQDVVNRIQEFLDERNIQYETSDITISSPGFGAATTLQPVTVTVAIPAAGNLLMPSEVIGNLRMDGSVTMVKEYENLENGS